MIIISGPSTVGKNPLIEHICQTTIFNFVTPVTTRKARNTETDGVDYFFLSQKEFKDQIIQNLLFEWDYCLSNYYGFYPLKNPENKITHALSRMAIRIKGHIKNTKTVFLYPKNIKKIEKTLMNIYSGTQLELRIFHMKEEIKHSEMFDFVFKVENGEDILTDKNFKSMITNHLC
ncbi:hypothetical protein CR161_06970 [Prosthecochloris sp. ZM]|uniref:hypothetical protein n=1 Tax=Prosthecochloris sp. ZM TaxID=2283143 RepID=UPI000DF84B51|nr:hypothetical protein [Prosthecochloris sp. ZM]RDD30473.1 hypothetical protein CR161_06970 [Prosthecochloris sp. ZM]